MTSDQFKDALFAQAKAYGYSDYEMYYSAADSFQVKIFNGEIAEYKNTDAVGVSFRGTYNGRVGYAYTERIDEAVIPDLLANAAGNAGIIEDPELEKLYPGDPEYPEANVFNLALTTVTAKTKIDAALAMEKFAYGLDARIKSVDYCMLGTENASTRIANGYGLNVADKANYVFAYLSVRAEENGVTKTGSELWLHNDFSQFSYEAVAKAAVARALSYLGAQSIPSGEYPVVFENTVACDLLSTFAGIFFAEQAQKGFSLLKDKVGTAIASPLVTLRDDGVCPKSFGSVSFDSEGVATKNKAVIENGVLKTLLYNTKSAAKDGVPSTGNGFKPSFRSPVGTACTNFYMVPSSTSKAQMIAGIANGVLITELAGLHSGTNIISGDFSLSADGFLIENGVIGRPVEQITVAGNFYSMLRDIDCLADDLRFDMPGASGSIGMPSFSVHGLRISGI